MMRMIRNDSGVESVSACWVALPPSRPRRDTIVTKLRWAREANRSKDRDDIRNILAVRASDLDWT
jgi:hypothetical protein